jgi:hypothetical protein
MIDKITRMAMNGYIFFLIPSLKNDTLIDRLTTIIDATAIPKADEIFGR